MLRTNFILAGAVKTVWVARSSWYRDAETPESKMSLHMLKHDQNATVFAMFVNYKIS